MPSFPNSNKVWCLTLKSHSKWCHVTRRGLAPRAASCPLLPASSPARLLTCSPGSRGPGRVTRSRPRLPPQSPRAAPPLPDPDWLSAPICIFLPLFAAGGQSARGARRRCWAGLGLQLLRPQVPERVAAAQGAPRTAPQPRALPPASARLSRLGQAPEAKTKRLFASAGPILPAVAGHRRLQDGLRRLRVFQELPVRTQPALHRESPESPFLPARGLCTCSGRCSSASQPGQRFSSCSPRPPPRLPTLCAPRASPSPPEGDQEPTLVAVSSFPLLCSRAVFVARWPGPCHIAPPRPLSHLLAFQLSAQTSPRADPSDTPPGFPKPIWGGLGGGGVGSGLRTVFLQKSVICN